MESHHDELLPISSDECGEGGEEEEAEGDASDDSDEDIVTDYHHLHHHHDYNNHHMAMMPVRPNTVGQSQGGGAGQQGGGGLPTLPTLPTISVTAHSPATNVGPGGSNGGLGKTYPVLEDSLQHVRDLQEQVHRMRDAAALYGNSYIPNTKDLTYALNPLLAQLSRLSASCPTLNESIPDLDNLGGSLGSSPLHQPPSRKGSGAQDWLCQPETHRRRSWTALEDLTGTKDKIKHVRQRSISLSSMESEADESSILDNVDGSTVRLLGTDPKVSRRGNRVSGGAASTHSLNEADLQNDFNKLKAKREAEALRLLPARLPLQKSVSTPSIIAVRELAPEAALGGAQPTLPVGRGVRPSGTESETEEEQLMGGRAGGATGRRSSGAHARFDPHHLQEHEPYDHHSEKRRKRGSIFFRKKKDKSKKITHQWVSGNYSSSHNCDFCNKPLSNKPALYCESCTTTVHQNTCKDSIAECSKSKGSKSSTKHSTFSVPLNPKTSMAKRGSGGSFGGSSQPTSNSQILCDDRDNDHHGHHDSVNFSDEAPLVPLEFLSDSPLTPAELCSDFSLGLHTTEPDSWTPSVGKDIARKLKEKEVKRQEHIYEFILTEKHHCMTLLVMQKIFVDGLHKYFKLREKTLERMFPRLEDLTQLHLGLLSRLRQRQREAPVINTIADILLDEFSKEKAAKLKSSYGEFCSRHRSAVEIYKELHHSDPRFAEFVRHCQTNPLLKKKGIPECILFVTQRLTKYPLLIEPLIKTSKENRKEQEDLQKALALVKEILVDVDAQVAEKEKEDRKLEIYNKIDAKSYTTHKGERFKKSDILQGNRALRFEGVAMLMQGRGKMQVVLVIVLSDVLFFLQENSNKFTFFTPDNKAGVVSLQKLLVREKAGQESRGIYLISSNPSDPEMFELKVHKPKDKHLWIQAIRSAVENCPEDEEDNANLTAEEKQSLQNAKQTQIRYVVGLLRQKDVEQALLLEEKIALQLRLLAAAGLDPPSPPSYSHLVSENADTGQMWKTVLNAVQEVSQLASSLYTTGTNLSRSVSSAGEHQSDAYVSPLLPKRAETFGGFDQSQSTAGILGALGPGLKLAGKKLQSSSGGTPTSAGGGGSGAGCSPEMIDMVQGSKPGDMKIFERLPFRNCVISGQQHPGMTNGNTGFPPPPSSAPMSSLDAHSGPPDIPALLSLGREQQYAAVHLSHYVYTLLCIISQLMTTNESLYAQLMSGKGGGDGGKQYRHNQQLEELRNLQDKLSVEKTTWAAKRDQESKELEEKRAEFIKLQEQVRSEQRDITQQREQLYRRMEVLTSQGLLISPNTVLPLDPQQQQQQQQAQQQQLGAGGGADNSSSSTTEDSSPQSDSSGGAAISGNTGTQDRRKEKWNNKGISTATGGPKLSQQLPLNLISATNQQKVSQLPVKQQIPFKLARLSSGGVGVPQANPPIGSQQMLPLKLSQEERVQRRTSTGYQRLGESRGDSFSPPSGDTTPTGMHSHSRTGSSPAMMQASPPLANTSPTGQTHHHPSYPPTVASGNSRAAARTNTYPKLPDKFKVRNDQVQPHPQTAQQQSQQTTGDEEVIYF